MRTSNKSIWEIIRTKKSKRSCLEEAILYDWLCKWFRTPFRIVIFPVMLVVKSIIKLYKFTYDID